MSTERSHQTETRNATGDPDRVDPDRTHILRRGAGPVSIVLLCHPWEVIHHDWG